MKEIIENSEFQVAGWDPGRGSGQEDDAQPWKQGGEALFKLVGVNVKCSPNV